MPNYFIELVSQKMVAKDTVEFKFFKPTEFSYLAGQYGVWTIPNLSPIDEKGNHRDITFSSAPIEKFLAITTRMRNTSFKNWLSAAKPGDQIEMEGPFGDLVLPKDTSFPIVFLAGGIGITPFRSMSLQAGHDKNPTEIILFFFDKSPEDMAYLEDLKILSSTNFQFQLIPIITKPEKSWAGETGYLTKELLKKYLEPLPAGRQVQLNSYLYLVAGSPAMVDAIQNTLSEAGIPPEQVVGENFGGY